VKVSKRVVHFGITDDEKKPGTKKGCRRANHYHMFCRGYFNGCTVLMAHMEVLLEAIIVASPTDWDTVLTWPKVRPGTVVRSVALLVALHATSDQGQALDANAASSSTFVAPLVASLNSLYLQLPANPSAVALDATSVHGQASDVDAASSSSFVAPPVASVTSLPLILNATVVQAHASDVNAASSSTFVAPPVAFNESLVPRPVSAAGEDLKLGRSVFVGLVLRRCSYLAVTWQFTALQFYIVSRSFGAHLSHLGPYWDPFQIASGAHFVLIFGLSYMR
jgi:hypothetical protein